MNKTVTLKRKGYPTIVRENRDGSKFTTRIRYQGKVHFFTLTELADTSFAAALAARREVQAGRWQQLKDNTRLRAECGTTLADIETAYDAYQPAPPKVLAADTKTKNLNALRNFLRKAGVEPVGTLPLHQLTGELVYQWKQNILADCRDKEPEDATRLCRSANSILIQARSVFADEARTYFERSAKLKLPACLAAFRKEPAFKQISKTEYHAPTDLIISKTFAHLASLNPARVADHTRLDTRNEFIACWLALGFGLRASEMAQARREDFQAVAGDIAFRPPWFGKNKKRTLEVLVQLDAWQHLGPIIEALPAKSFVLYGHETERTSDVFRRISGWMRALGWETTHHIHELRAWAGSYIADHAAGDGIRSAQIFLRHASYATTEKFYGHHRKQQLAKVTLTIPKVEQPSAAAAVPANVVAMQ
jgi:integrase